MTFTLGSLFTGIGGIDLAFQRAGFDIAWQVEIDDYCQKVLYKHWPHVPKLRDVRTCTGRTGRGWRRYHQLLPVDVMAGGFPCQDISIAGKGAGIKEGTRSGLWFEFARLIGELRPRVVLLENVARITSKDGHIVLSSLAEMGYDAEWGTLFASDTGAPHRRERWFCIATLPNTYSVRRQSESTQQDTALYQEWNMETPERERGTILHAFESGSPNELEYSNSAGREEQHPSLVAGDEGHNPWRSAAVVDNSEGGRDCGNTVSVDTETAERGQQANGRKPECKGCHCGECRKSLPEPRLGRVLNGLSAGLDGHKWVARPNERQHDWEPPRITNSSQPYRNQRIKALGNAVVPQVVEPIARLIHELLEREQSCKHGICRKNRL